MYYLLGYKLFGEKEGEMMAKLSARNKRTSPDTGNHIGHVGKSAIFDVMEEQLVNQVGYR